MYTTLVYRRENCDVPSVDGALAAMCLKIDCGYLLILYDIDLAGQYHKPLGRSRNLGPGSSKVQETQLMCRTRRLRVCSAYKGDKFNPRVVHNTLVTSFPIRGQDIRYCCMSVIGMLNLCSTYLQSFKTAPCPAGHKSVDDTTTDMRRLIQNLSCYCRTTGL